MGSALRVFDGVRRHSGRIAVAGGAVLVVLGVLQVAGVWSVMITSLQGVVVGWQAPL
jgi:cytochrome c-type biogenesis protein